MVGYDKPIQKNIDSLIPCDKCKDGFIYSNNFRSSTWCECALQKEQIRNAMDKLLAIGVSPVHFHTYNYEELDCPTGINSLIKFANSFVVEDKKPWLYLHGGPGTGKTFTSFILMILCSLTDKSVFYVNFPKFLEKTRPGENMDQNLLDYCLNVDFLVLDDIGQEKYSDWVRERLYLILDSRYFNKKQTAITSNFGIKDLDKRLQSKPIISRISHFSNFIKFSGDDRRLKYSLEN